MLQIGDLKIRVVSGGRFRLDGGAMFGVVPRPLWSQKTPVDEPSQSFVIEEGLPTLSLERLEKLAIKEAMTTFEGNIPEDWGNDGGSCHDDKGRKQEGDVPVQPKEKTCGNPRAKKGNYRTDGDQLRDC